MTNFKLNGTHKKIIMDWFQIIGETDKEIMESVLKACREDHEHTITCFLPQLPRKINQPVRIYA